MALIQRSSNPAFSEKLFQNQGFVTQSEAMSIQGTVNKSLMMFVLVFASAMWTWSLYDPANPSVSPITWIGMIGGLMVGLITIFKPTTSPITAPIYAVLEGLFLGGKGLSP